MMGQALCWSWGSSGKQNKEGPCVLVFTVWVGGRQMSTLRYTGHEGAWLNLELESLSFLGGKFRLGGGIHNLIHVSPPGCSNDYFFPLIR